MEPPTHLDTFLRYTLPIAFFFSVYVYFYDGTLATLLSWSRITAGTSSILIGLSLGMGSWAYFLHFHIPNELKKQVGNQGFWLAFVYSCMLCLLYPEQYWYGLWDNILTYDVSLGLIAMVLLGVMTFITEQPFVSYVGERCAHSFLRIGYLAYALLVIRAVCIEWDVWMAWAHTLQSLPPPRILLSIFAVAVLCMRAWVPLDVAYHKGEGIAPNA